jgi:hypothetical protein
VQISASPIPPAILAGSADAAGHHFHEHADQANHRTEQTEQRADQGDGAQRVEVALHPVHHVPTGILDALLDQLARAVAHGQRRASNSPSGEPLASVSMWAGSSWPERAHSRTSSPDPAATPTCDAKSSNAPVRSPARSPSRSGWAPSPNRQPSGFPARSNPIAATI